jgi:site-specific recombinase XerD
MMQVANKVMLLSGTDNSTWIAVYCEAWLSHKNSGTIDVYQRVLRDFLLWLTERLGYALFHFHQLARTMVETYMASLEEACYSASHRMPVISVISSFCQWLIDEYGFLKRNPARGLELPAQQVLVPRVLSDAQRTILRVEAFFALGYWAGYRVSDVAHLLIEYTHVGPKFGWLHIGHKGGKSHDIDLLNQTWRTLFEYFQYGGRDPESIYVFTSQRNPRLSEAGIHHWFRTLKQQANKDQWEKIAALSFHDLRHGFAHRAREVGWTLEEIAYYLGHVTQKGTPAIQTTARYTQVSREQIKEKLKLLGK